MQARERLVDVEVRVADVERDAVLDEDPLGAEQPKREREQRDETDEESLRRLSRQTATRGSRTRARVRTSG